MNNENEIIQGNKLIAIFMGATIGRGTVVYPNDYRCADTNLIYHSSWNELMSVVEKIESVGAYSFEIDKYKVRVCHIMTWKDKTVFYAETIEKKKIEVVWSAVVEFIKYYNKISDIQSAPVAQ